MRLADFRRVSFLLGVKTMLAYLGNKIFRKQLVRNQSELLYYFRQLKRMNVFHAKDLEKYFLVTSREYGDFYLRKPFSSDYKVFRQIFLNLEYLPLAKLVEENCHYDTVVMIDGGANIGLTTVYMNHYFKNRKKIISVLVEPFEDNIESASLNLRSHGIETSFFEHAGLHNKKCFLKLDRGFIDGKEWAIQIVESSEPTNLKSIEINDVLNKYNFETIDILKLDIEGAERFLFEDEQYASAFLSNVRIIAMELHQEYDIEEEVLRILRINNFEVVKVRETYVGVKKVPSP